MKYIDKLMTILSLFTQTILIWLLFNFAMYVQKATLGAKG